MPKQLPPLFLLIAGCILVFFFTSLFTYAFMAQPSGAQTRGLAPAQIDIPLQAKEAAIHIGWNDLAAVATVLTVALSAVHIIVTRIVIAPMIAKELKGVPTASSFDAHEDLDKQRYESLDKRLSEIWHVVNK